MSLITDCFITRTELSLADLDLSSGTYNVEGEEGLGMGAVTWDRKVARSPWVDGGVPVQQHKAMSRGSLNVRVTSSTATALQSALDTLITAFYQSTYEIHIDLDSIEYAWTCYAADMAMNPLDGRWKNNNVSVLFQFLRDPTPITGPV